jgi:hypothetical protein
MLTLGIARTSSALPSLNRIFDLRSQGVKEKGTPDGILVMRMVFNWKQLRTTKNNDIHVGVCFAGWQPAYPAGRKVRRKGVISSAAVATDVRLYGLKDIKGLKGLAASAAVGLYLDATKYNLALKHLLCFCPYRAYVPAIANPGRCPGLLAYWPFRPY